MIVSTIFSCATICEPTAPRPATTRSCERFRTAAGALERTTAPAVVHPRPPPARSCCTGARPSATADHASISAAEGTDIQAKSAHGSSVSLFSPVSIFCWREALAARRTLLRTARASPSTEKWTSPREQRTQPATTRHVGRSSHRSNGMPSIITNGTDMMGCVAISISERATEQSSSTLFPTPMQVAKQSAMGRIVKRNSDLVGTGTACPLARER
mmetsp:Transcript_127302/g.396215  ORF Transcript_127302/g.396215 Transcript_127302/m.396215 type:complete len:215 (+) Transcript_127302:214-858(+)